MVLICSHAAIAANWTSAECSSEKPVATSGTHQWHGESISGSYYFALNPSMCFLLRANAWLDKIHVHIKNILSKCFSTFTGNDEFGNKCLNRKCKNGMHLAIAYNIWIVIDVVKNFPWISNTSRKMVEAYPPTGKTWE